MPTPAPDTGILLLAPGHLGTPADLSVRVVHALRDAALVLVESGTLPALAATRQTLALPQRPTAEIPSSDELPEAVGAAILAALEAGGRVVLFGGEEGIPGYADPGAAVLRLVRARCPEVPIRSLGGSSVIGTALMAAGLGMDRVTMLGVTTAPPEQRERKLREVGRWVRRLASPEHAVAVFAPGRDVPEIAGRLATIGWLNVHLVVCAALTLPDERVVSGSPREIIAASFSADTPTCVFVTSTLRIAHPRAWWAGISRIWG